MNPSWPFAALDTADLADWLRHHQACDSSTTAVTVIFHRDELAIVVRLLDTLVEKNAHEATTEAVERNTHQQPSLADCEASWNANQDEPTLNSTPKSGYLHDFPSLQVDAGAEELLKELNEKSDDAWSDILRTYDPYATIGTNGRLLPGDVTEAMGRPLVVARRLTSEEKQARDRLASTRPKEYGQGQYGPVEIRRPGWPASACGPKTPSCLPAFGILGSTLGTAASTGSSVDAASPHTDRTAAARIRSVRRGLGET